MSKNSYNEMERACVAHILRQICVSAGLDPKDVFMNAAEEVAGHFGDREIAHSLLADLRLD